MANRDQLDRRDANTTVVAQMSQIVQTCLPLPIGFSASKCQSATAAVTLWTLGIEIWDLVIWKRVSSREKEIAAIYFGRCAVGALNIVINPRGRCSASCGGHLSVYGHFGGRRARS